MATDVEMWLREEGERFLQDVGIEEGGVVLDFGCGVGHYAIPAAKAVGEEGKVYAVDKDEGVLSSLSRTARAVGLENIVTLNKSSGDASLDLGDESVDMVLLYDVLHFMSAQERAGLYDELHRLLKPGGLLSVNPEHHKGDWPMWTLSNVDLEDLIQEIQRAGFHLEARLRRDLLHDRQCRSANLLSFRRQAVENPSGSSPNGR